MKRTLVVVAAVVGFAAAASAGTLTVFTTDVANVVTNTFNVGDTILLKITGDGEGNTTEDSLNGELHWNGAITTTIDAVQGNWLPVLGIEFEADGQALVLNQVGSPVLNQVQTSVVTLTADATGVSVQTWGGSLLDFFGIYSYNSTGPINGPVTITGHSFTIVGGGGVVPEPTTAGLVGLGLLGLVLGGRRRA
jgi:hypothetical protein